MRSQFSIRAASSRRTGSSPQFRHYHETAVHPTLQETPAASGAKETASDAGPPREPRRSGAFPKPEPGRRRRANRPASAAPNRRCRLAGSGLPDRGNRRRSVGETVRGFFRRPAAEAAHSGRRLTSTTIRPRMSPSRMRRPSPITSSRPTTLVSPDRVSAGKSRASRRQATRRLS